MTQSTLEISEQAAEMTNRQVDSKPKKTKVTIYLTEEAEHAFTELYIARYRKNKKIDRSTIACEAIQALYEKECNK